MTLSDPMTEDKCRAMQIQCSSKVHDEIAGIREIVQLMDRERSGNAVRFSQLVQDVAEIKANVAVIRKESDTLYAMKLVEKIAFGLVGLLCVGVITALVKLVLVP
jgi:hypothetical protein